MSARFEEVDAPERGPNHRPRTIWIDVSDLFWFFSHASNPSGIQRLTGETAAALLMASARFRVSLCRIDQVSGRIIPVKAEEVFELYRRNIPERSSRKRSRQPLLHGAVAELRRFWVRRLRGGVVKILARTSASPRAEIDARSGDILLCMGSHWIVDGHADIVRRYRGAQGLRFVLLCYDLIPLTHRHWFPKSTQRAFRGWFDAVAAQAEVVLTISRYTATQVERYFEKTGRSPGIVIPIRIGHGFPATGHLRPIDMHPPRPPPEIVGPFALFVSTIEARKNHSFLIRVWQRLLEQHASAEVPQLVFVGRQGGAVDDLFQQLENADYLDGKILVLTNVPDSLLGVLYKRCTLALYPSLEEGYGLPVAEAVLAGAICVASNKASIPEVVGDAIDYFDPDDFGTAYSLIDRALFDQGYRAELRRRAEGFVPRSWGDTASNILDAIERHVTASAKESVFHDE